jgi:hypothetical protein
MKFQCLFAIVGFIFETFPAFALQEPSYPISKEVLVSLAGPSQAARQKGPFTCQNLLEKTWPYPSAEILSMCYDAERSCYTYQLLKANQKDQSSQQAKTLTDSLGFSATDAQLKLTACMVALEHSGVGNSQPPIPSYGSYVVIPSIPLVRPQKLPSLPTSPLK